MSDPRKYTESERALLKKFYECQELMEKLLDKGSQDPDYIIMKNLIKRLEDYIVSNNSNII